MIRQGILLITLVTLSGFANNPLHAQMVKGAQFPPGPPPPVPPRRDGSGNSNGHYAPNYGKLPAQDVRLENMQLAEQREFLLALSFANDRNNGEEIRAELLLRWQFSVTANTQEAADLSSAASAALRGNDEARATINNEITRQAIERHDARNEENRRPK